MNPRERIADVRLYVVLSPGALPGDPRAALERALSSGAIGAVQLRLENGSGNAAAEGAVDAWARDVASLCAAHGALFLLNDDPARVAELAADGVEMHGVHVGQADPAPADARLAVGPERLVGLSTHDPDEVRAANHLAAAHGGPVDYVGLGPCFPTDSKALSRAPGGAALVAACLPEAPMLPVFPIGGITPDNASALVAAGADRLAVGAGVLAAADPRVAASRLLDLLP